MTSVAEIVKAVPVAVTSFWSTYVAPATERFAGAVSEIALPGTLNAPSGTRHATA